MSTTDLRATHGPSGVRIHRVTCKKMKNGVRIGAILSKDLAEAKAASCCKPREGEVTALIADAADLQNLAAAPAQVREEVAATVTPPLASDLSTGSRILKYRGAKHFFNHVGWLTAKYVAIKHGVRATRDTKLQEITFHGDLDKILDADEVMEEWMDLAPDSLVDFKASPEGSGLSKAGPDIRKTYATYAKHLQGAGERFVDAYTSIALDDNDDDDDDDDDDKDVL